MWELWNLYDGGKLFLNFWTLLQKYILVHNASITVTNHGKENLIYPTQIILRINSVAEALV